MSNKAGVKGAKGNKLFGSPRHLDIGSPATSRMTTRRNTVTGKTSENDSTVSCNVDKKLLDSLINSLQGLRSNLKAGNQDQAHGLVDQDDVEVDPSDLNNVLHHLLKAVNDLTLNVQVVRGQCDEIEKVQDTTVAELKKRMRVNEDEIDECKQRSRF